MANYQSNAMSFARRLGRTALALAMGAGFALGATGEVRAAGPYPAMAPLDQYLMADRDEEIAFARTAAPASVSSDAEILVLGRRGYEKAVEGKNGFVCLVERSWFSPLGDHEFWNPKERSPNCLNRQGARSVLPMFMARTEWVLAGLSKTEIVERTRAALASGQIRPPETATLVFMMSKDGYLSDAAGGPWHPHVMFYMPRMNTDDWGANLPGSPVQTAPATADDPYETYFVPVARWSDGSPDVKHPM
jgi:hypothetical protein